MTVKPTTEITTPKSLSKAKTISTFAATTLLSGGVSILSIPLIVILTDAQSWGSIALGQAVGSSVGVLAMFGWGITGPSTIAMMPVAHRPAAYWESITARGLLFVPALIVTVGATWALAPSDHLAASVCGVAMVFGGLSGSWYVVGAKRPDLLFTLDTVPRIAGTVAGICTLWAGASLVTFGICQLVGSAVAVVLVTRWAVPGFRRPEHAARGFRQTLRVIAQQRHGVTVAVAIASFYPAVLAIVATFTPAYLPLYALIEKVLRFASMAMQPMFQYFQATVPTHTGAALFQAIRRSLGVATLLGAVSWAGFTVLLPLSSDILTAGQVDVPILVAINLGAYTGGTVVVTFLSTVALIAVSRVRAIGRSALAGASLGVVVVFAIASAGEGESISWGFVVMVSFLLLYQVMILIGAMRSNPQHG